MAGLMTREPVAESTLLDSIALPGRKSELRQFIKALTLCRTGQGKAVLLSGDEGIGKTALLEAFLKIGEQGYNSHAITITITPRTTTATLFVTIVQEVLEMAGRIMAAALADVNTLLQPFGLRWGQGDLIRLIALMRLQESVDSRQKIAKEQLSEIIYKGVPFFKRFRRDIRVQIDQLAAILSDPWLTLAISVVNPINPQVQHALSLVEAILGKRRQEIPLFASTSAIPLLTGTPLNEEEMAALPRLPLTELPSAQGGLEAQEEEDEFSAEPPQIPSLQQSLIDLLVFLNQALRGEQAALIIAFDQWDALLEAPDSEAGDIKAMLGELLRQTVEQRDFRMMMLVAARSGGESYSLGGLLYNALRMKYLATPLTPTTQAKIIKETFGARGFDSDTAVVQEITRISRGNAAWLKLMLHIITMDMGQTQLPYLDWHTYQERFAVREASDVLEQLYTRMMLGFVGRDNDILKLLDRLLTRHGNTPFTPADATATARNIIGIDDIVNLVMPLLEALENLGFLVRVDSPEVDATGMQPLAFPTAAISGFLKAKTRPLHEDVPSQDKVASLRKILPVAIQSGELSREKTQELLAMASALEDGSGLLGFVEQTLIDALHQDDLPVTTHCAVLESLSLLGTPGAIEALLDTLDDESAVLRENALHRALPLANRANLPFSRNRLANAVISKTQDPQASVRIMAFQFLAACLTEDDIILPILNDGLRNPDVAIRSICLGGLTRRRVTTPEMLSLYRDLMYETRDVEAMKLVLRGLQQADRDQSAAMLVEYLEKQPSGPLWREVLIALSQTHLDKAMPWLSVPLSQPNEDPDLKLTILKRLGGRPNREAEAILVRTLETAAANDLPPEQRWMAIRSLGWIAQSPASLMVLESQEAICRNDDILSRSLQNAIRQVSERLSVPEKSVADSLPQPEFESTPADEIEPVIQPEARVMPNVQAEETAVILEALSQPASPDISDVGDMMAPGIEVSEAIPVEAPSPFKVPVSLTDAPPLTDTPPPVKTPTTESLSQPLTEPPTVASFKEATVAPKAEKPKPTVIPSPVKKSLTDAPSQVAAKPASAEPDLQNTEPAKMPAAATRIEAVKNGVFKANLAPAPVPRAKRTSAKNIPPVATPPMPRQPISNARRTKADIAASKTVAEKTANGKNGNNDTPPDLTAPPLPEMATTRIDN